MQTTHRLEAGEEVWNSPVRRVGTTAVGSAPICVDTVAVYRLRYQHLCLRFITSRIRTQVPARVAVDLSPLLTIVGGRGRGGSE